MGFLRLPVLSSNPGRSRGLQLAIACLAIPLLTAGRCGGGGGNPGGGPGGGDPGPPYPIVLAHGALGMESYGPLEYWFGIVSALEDAGNDVHVTQVSAIHSSTVRGEQLLEQVEAILIITGKDKVHLIGHSQGGLDARYVAGVRPDLVASVTTVGSPHKGALVFDELFDGILADGTFTAALLDLFGSSIGVLLELLFGTSDPVDARAALSNLVGSGIDDFNALFPNGLPAGCHPGAAQVGDVRYYSWTGKNVLTNFLDPTDTLLGLASVVYLFQQNDGLVTVCSAQFGDVLEDDYWMNHLDEVNQILGLTHLFEVDPKTPYVQHATRLRNLGL